MQSIFDVPTGVGGDDSFRLSYYDFTAYKTVINSSGPSNEYTEKEALKYHRNNINNIIYLMAIQFHKFSN